MTDFEGRGVAHAYAEGRRHIRRLNEAARETEAAAEAEAGLAPARRKKYLFFDTETTGKADFRSPADAAHQPRLVQLAALLTDEDGRELSSINVIIQPGGFEIPIEASAIHGISTAAAFENGVPLRLALPLFLSLAEQSDFVVCHNAEFDLHILTGECIRLAADVPGMDVQCTMKLMTPICRLPGPYGQYKWPKLQEAYQHAFGRPFAGAHDALADVRACKEVFFWHGLNAKDAKVHAGNAELEKENAEKLKTEKYLPTP